MKRTKINLGILALLLGGALAFAGTDKAQQDAYGFDETEGWVNINDLPPGYSGYQCTLSQEDCLYDAPNGNSIEPGDFELIPE